MGSALGLAAAFLADLAAPLPYPIAALYAIPILIAARGTSASAAVAGGAALVVFVVGGVLQDFPPEALAMYGAALAVVAYLAVRLAAQRERTMGQAGDAEVARARLDQTTRTLEALVRESPLAIIVSNPDGTVRLWNPAAERIFGWRADEVVGRFLPTVPEESHEEVLRNLRAALEGRSLRGAEAVRRRKDGTMLEVALWSAPLPGVARGDGLGPADGTGSAGAGAAGGTGRESGPGVLTLMADNTDRVAARRDLERLAAALGEAVRARDEFLTVAAHELKTPATSLRGFAQLTLRRMEKTGVVEPAEVRRAMETIDQQTQRLARLTEQLLDVSRIQGGRLTLERRETDLAALVCQAAATAQAFSERHELRTVMPDEPVRALVDPLRLEQVMANLLDNAIRYSPEGGPVEVTLSADGGWVRIVVRDEGIGIPPERKEAVFERFHQAHPEAHYGGMGLGLHICREIVALHGGAIRAELPERGGTRVVVDLPAGLPVDVPASAA